MTFRFRDLRSARRSPPASPPPRPPRTSPSAISRARAASPPTSSPRSSATSTAPASSSRTSATPRAGRRALMGLAGGSLDLGSAATAAVLNSIAGGNDFVIAYANNGIDEGRPVDLLRARRQPDPEHRGHRRQDHRGQHARRPSRLHGARGPAPEGAAEGRRQPRRRSRPAARAGAARRPGRHRRLRLLADDLRGRWPASNGGIRPVFDDTDVLGEIAGGFVVLRRDWVDAHPEQARIFVGAVGPRARLCPRAPRGNQGDLRQGAGGARREPRARPVLPRLRRARGRAAGRCATSSSGSTSSSARARSAKASSSPRICCS